MFAAALWAVAECSQAISYVNRPKLRECKLTEEGIYYLGTTSVSVSGKTCQMWHTHDEITNEAFRGDSVSQVMQGLLLNISFRNVCIEKVLYIAVSFNLTS